MKAAIVTIGDEILIGQIVNTNSSWMAQKMTVSGFEVSEIISIGDDAQQIKDTIKDLFQRVDVILTTGGLGPTKDDITKRTLCEYYNTELVFDELVYENITRVVAKQTYLNELTRNQAYVPKDCTVIQNEVGTAPITWFERNGKVLVSMPGVPYEMKYAMENQIVTRLQKKYQTESYVSHVLIVNGYTESALAIHLTDFENNLPEGFGLAYLPGLSIMRLRLFVKGEHRREELNVEVDKLRVLLGKAIIAEKDISIEEILGNKLSENNLALSTAESCTGGNIAHMITSVSGSSRYFKGSIVSYSNEVKEHSLGVSMESLRKFGAVSEKVVQEMALGVQLQMKTDCSIAVSGIAGPDGGSDEKPVGTVWICTRYKDQERTELYRFGKFRDANIGRATNKAMLQLIEMIDSTK